MKQKDFFTGTPFSAKKEHGGALSAGRRRSRRPLSTKHALHLTLRSDFAYGKRSLLRHRPAVERIMRKAAVRFQVSVYRHAVCSNHLHLLVRGKSRTRLQNFFRVFAGHLAQEILREFPLSRQERGGAPEPALARPKAAAKNCRRPPHPKNQRKFWALLIYSRVVSWGRDFRNVVRYILQNTLEALFVIAYKARVKRKGRGQKRGASG